MSEFAGQFPKTAAAIDAGRSQNLHLGAQLYISRHGQTLADAAFGQSRPGVDMTPNSIPLWLSAGKPFAAVAIAQFWEAGQLDLDDPVVRFIPEFAARGKQAVTIRHLLTHTAGLRWVEWSPSWQEMISRICNAPLEPRWIPGQTAGYHPFTTWYLLGEIIRRLDPTHRPYEAFIAEEVFRPLGMTDCFFAMSPDQYRAYAARIAPLELTNQSNGRPAFFDTQSGCAVCSPGASGRGPAHQLGRFYEMLLAHPGAPGLLKPQTVETLTSRQRIGMHDITFKHIIDWGLGFIVNSAHYGEAIPYGFGNRASLRAFGHGGSQSSVAMADPEYGVAIVVIFNGMPGEDAHQRRMRATLEAVYEDLGIGGKNRNLKSE
ncbi:MAG TPA: serine hydrolase domain-containing protein [Tepidisphaeraceae bacterium]|jgi:CubicO group peptidase (beta-lactamase class C family)|nr:serine hydrolase domain-containing protein [Tepidisphaeraceae bacterium]